MLSMRSILGRILAFVLLIFSGMGVLEALHVSVVALGDRGVIQPYIALCKKIQIQMKATCRIVANSTGLEKLMESYNIEYKPIPSKEEHVLPIIKLDFFGLAPVKNFYVEFMEKQRMLHWTKRVMIEIERHIWPSNLIIADMSFIMSKALALTTGKPIIRTHMSPHTYSEKFKFPSPHQWEFLSMYNPPLLDITIITDDDYISQYIEPSIKEFLDLRNGHYYSQLLYNPPNVLGIYGMPISLLPEFPVAEHPVISKAIRYPTFNNIMEYITGPWTIPSGYAGMKPPDDLRNVLGLDYQGNRLSSNPHVVYFGFGSVQFKTGEEVFRKLIIPLVRALKVNAVIAVGSADKSERGAEVQPDDPFFATNLSYSHLIPYDLRYKVYIQSTLPHDYIFKYVDLAVHHGGIGTIYTTLLHAVPSLIIPLEKDQPFWAERLDKYLAYKGDPEWLISEKWRSSKESMIVVIKSLLADKQIKINLTKFKKELENEPDGVIAAVEAIDYYYKNVERREQITLKLD